MTPKEKAKELVKKYIQFRIDGRARVFGLALSKQFALIAVDEIISELTQEISPSVHGFRHRYWNEVKHEIEKI